MGRLENFIEYAKLHLISLKQDYEKSQGILDSIEDMNSDEYEAAEIYDVGLGSQIYATEHLLSVAEGILNSPLAVRLGEINE